MISIIIPTLNEEKYLPRLLESIKNQNFSDYEIIVADAGSVDKTREIAKLYNCRITGGGLPAKGRNEGAKIARGDILLFLDADTYLEPYFLEKAILEFRQRNLDVASFSLIPTPFKRYSHFLFNTFYNNPIIFFEKVLPHAAMGILFKKDLFEKTGGFDEEIKLAEDVSLVRYVTKNFRANFGIIRSTKLFISDRRFKKDGWVRTGIKYLACELHLIFLGPVKTNIFNYKFNHYEN